MSAFDGRVALVTAGGSGIRRASALAFARQVDAVCLGLTRTGMLEAFTGGDPQMEKALASGTRSPGWPAPKR